MFTYLAQACNPDRATSQWKQDGIPSAKTTMLGKIPYVRLATANHQACMNRAVLFSKEQQLEAQRPGCTHRVVLCISWPYTCQGTSTQKRRQYTCSDAPGAQPVVKLLCSSTLNGERNCLDNQTLELAAAYNFHLGHCSDRAACCCCCHGLQDCLVLLNRLQKQPFTASAAPFRP